MSAAVPILPPSAVVEAPILVATDGRPESAAALVVAARLAERLGGPPHVLDVVEPLPVYAEVPVDTARLFEDECTTTARDVVGRQLDEVGGATWPLRVVAGLAAPTIAESAAEQRASVVVLGIGRHRVLDRLFGSETALQVLRSAGRPVLAVGPEADGRIMRAVVAVDFEAASTRAASLACRMLAPGGTLSLVHVRSFDESDDARTDDMLRRLAVSLRNGGAPGCTSTHPCPGLCASAVPGRRDVTIGTATLIGDPAAEVLDYAESVGAELIAVGTRGAGLLERIIIGSVATDILRRTSARLPRCSVLACPELLTDGR